MEFRNWKHRNWKHGLWSMLLSVLLLNACDNTPTRSANTDPEPPPPITDPVAHLPNVAVPGEAVIAGANQAVIHLVDLSTLTAAQTTAASSNSDNLYLWNDSSCDALATPSANWNDASATPTGSDSYGPYWVVPLNKMTGCIHFILRDSNLNKLIGSDMTLSFSDFSNRTVSIIAGNGQLFATRADAFKAAFGVSQAQAHWVDKQTLLWPAGEGQPYVRLYYNLKGNVAPNAAGEYTDSYLALTPTTLSAETAARFPNLANYAAFALPAAAKIDPLLTGELIAIATDQQGVLTSATQVQTAGVLDDRFAAAAEGLSYGAQPSSTGTLFRLWAPTAQQVNLVIYRADKTVQATYPMIKDTASGSWSWQGTANLDGSYYRYALTVYHPLSRKFEQYDVTDPYSLSLSTNSEYSQVINLNDSALKPDGWDNVTAPHAQATKADVAKIVIHEVHMRDLSASDSTVPAAYRGKYLAFTANNSNVMQHLQALNHAGVTHLELMPVFDLATINESTDKVADLDQPFSRLCSVNNAVAQSPFASYCSSSQTIADVLTTLKTSDSADNPQVQALNALVDQTDSYNWGYDPFHYTTPEGSYSTNPEGSLRIKEFRTMVQTIKQQLGMNVIMDVVYNHTNAAGPTSPTSVLDKIVPWYYQRLDEVTGNVESNTCCSDTAPEHLMFAKLIEDSLVVWSRDYKIDGFRFDLMGYHPKAEILAARDKVRSVNPNTYFLGEGWDSGQGDRFEIASQITMKGTGVGTFSDRLRDAVRGGGPFDSGDDIRKNQGLGNGAGTLPNEITTMSDDDSRHLADLVRLGMAGNLTDFVLIDKDGAVKTGSQIDYNGAMAGYAADPTEVVNYVGKHDNQTLWDMISYKAAQNADLATRVRMQAVSLATVMLGQGLAFDQQGSELLRSKSFARDSYDSGDWYNRVDYQYQTNNYDVGFPDQGIDGSNYDLITLVKDMAAKPGNSEILQMSAFYQELTSLRNASPLMTLGDGASIMKRVDFRNTGPDQQLGLLVMTLDDGSSAGSDLDSAVNALVVVINASPASRTINDFVGDQLQISPIQQALGSASLAYGTQVAADGSITVPAWSVVVLQEKQQGAQGAGIPVIGK